MLDSVGRPTEWTPERTNLLKKLWADGLSCSRIAAELGGTSRNAVIGKVHRLGLPGRLTITTTPRYRSGPVSYEEKQRREAERLARKTLAIFTKAERRRTQTVKPPVFVIEPPKPAEFLNLTFDQLASNSCRYPRGDWPDMRFCGQPKMVEHSYCAYCYGITHYQQPTDSTPKRNTKWVNSLMRWAA